MSWDNLQHPARPLTALPYSLHFLQASQFTAFTFCLHTASRSARVEILRPLHIFPVHVHSPVHPYGLLDIQEYVGAFQSPIDISFPNFSFNLWVSLCTNYYPSTHAAIRLKHLPIIVSTNAPSPFQRKRAFHAE